MMLHVTHTPGIEHIPQPRLDYSATAERRHRQGGERHCNPQCRTPTAAPTEFKDDVVCCRAFSHVSSSPPSSFLCSVPYLPSSRSPSSILEPYWVLQEQQAQSEKLEIAPVTRKGSRGAPGCNSGDSARLLPDAAAGEPPQVQRRATLLARAKAPRRGATHKCPSRLCWRSLPLRGLGNAGPERM